MRRASYHVECSILDIANSLHFLYMNTSMTEGLKWEDVLIRSATADLEVVQAANLAASPTFSPEELDTALCFRSGARSGDFWGSCDMINIAIAVLTGLGVASYFGAPDLAAVICCVLGLVACCVMDLFAR